MVTNQKKKPWKVIITLLLIGFGYFIFVSLTGYAIPCMFRVITGKKCPGCGITTMFLCLARLDFNGAFEANLFLLITLPLLVAEILYIICRKQREGRLNQANKVFQIIYITALIVFGVVRNIME